uniref:Uncharacterized protein n=1 Tax=Arundo donax TaxID=35708 RepID=A0A0A9EML9_ARUDO
MEADGAPPDIVLFSHLSPSTVPRRASSSSTKGLFVWAGAFGLLAEKLLFWFLASGF